MVKKAQISMLHVVDDLHIHKVLVADDVRANFKGLLSNFVASPLAARRPVESVAVWSVSTTNIMKR